MVGRVAAFVRNSAVTPGPSRECDISPPFKLTMLRDDRNLAVQWRHAERRELP